MTPAKQAVGRLRVLVSPWANVLVDGKLRAVTPLDRALELSRGSHRIRLENPHFEPLEQDVVITDQFQTLRLTLTPRRDK